MKDIKIVRVNEPGKRLHHPKEENELYVRNSIAFEKEAANREANMVNGFPFIKLPAEIRNLEPVEFDKWMKEEYLNWIKLNK